MSRSRRKTPIIGMTTARSNKRFKVAEHQRERAAVRVAVRTGREQPDPKDFGDEWASPRDGKQRVDSTSRWMRK